MKSIAIYNIAVIQHNLFWLLSINAVDAVSDWRIFVVSVNLVYEQGFRGKAAMGANPQKPAWTANKAIDGDASQSYLSDTCAITNVDENQNTSIWWKVWLQQHFNVANLEIYFRSDSKFMKNKE